MARTADVVIMMLDATKGEVQRSVVGQGRLACPGKPWGEWWDTGCSSCVPELLVGGPGALGPVTHESRGRVVHSCTQCEWPPQEASVWRLGLCHAGLGVPSAAQNPPGAQPQAAEPCSRPDLRLRAHQPVSPWVGQSVRGSSLLSLVARSDVRELVVWGRGLSLSRYGVGG